MICKKFPRGKEKLSNWSLWILAYTDWLNLYIYLYILYKYITRHKDIKAAASSVKILLFGNDTRVTTPREPFTDTSISMRSEGIQGITFGIGLATGIARKLTAKLRGPITGFLSGFTFKSFSVDMTARQRVCLKSKFSFHLDGLCLTAQLNFIYTKHLFMKKQMGTFAIIFSCWELSLQKLFETHITEACYRQWELEHIITPGYDKHCKIYTVLIWILYILCVLEAHKKLTMMWFPKRSLRIYFWHGINYLFINIVLK